VTAEDPHHKAADAVHEGRPVEAQYVRGGRGGRRILLVLLAGLVLVAIGFGLMYLVWGPSLSATNPNDGDQKVDAAAFEGDAGNPPLADAPTTSSGEPTNPATGQASNVNAPRVRAQTSAEQTGG